MEKEQEVQSETAATADACAGDGQVDGAASGSAETPKKKISRLDEFFGITKSGSNIKTEIIAGLTTFMAMVYAILVVPGMYGVKDPVSGIVSYPNVSFNAVYIATALGAVIGTSLMAFLAKMPLAQASGLGATAYITGTLIGGELHLTYANSMIFVLLDGIIFVLLTATGLRKKILKAIPDEVKSSIPVGIGMFIALIGMKNVGLVNLSDGAIGFASFNVLKGKLSYLTTIAAAITLFTVIAIGILSAKKVKGGILWGMLGATALYYAFAGLGCAWKNQECLDFFHGFTITQPFAAFADWGKESVGQVFIKGFIFPEGLNAGQIVLLIVTSALSLCMIDMFDTLGTLYGACSKGNLLDEEGNPLRMNKCMLSDAIATCAGSVCGASTVTTYVEASSGVAAGGKTGFTALVTAICFFITLFLSPIAKIIPDCATAAALIWVGVLMMSSVKDIKWSDPAAALPAFLTIAVMAFGFSISFGIGIGIISCVLVKLFTGKVKEISVVTWVIAALFILMFLLTN